MLNKWNSFGQVSFVIAILILQLTTLIDGKIKNRYYMEIINLEPNKTPLSSITMINSRDATFPNNQQDKIKLEVKEVKPFNNQNVNANQFLNTICSLFTSRGFDEYGNTLMILRDYMAGNDKIVDKDKAIEYMLHIAGFLGLPSFTYVADRIGQMELKQESMVLRLEPGAAHIAHAMLDFLKTYNWNTISIVVDTRMPGYQALVHEVKRLREELKKSKSNFIFDITKEVTFTGITLLDLRTCVVKCTEVHNFPKHMDPAEKCVKPQCLKKFRNVLDELKKTNDRIFLFHGTSSDLLALVTTAWQLKEQNYYNLFGKEYVWIVSPAGIGAIKDTDRPKLDENSHQPETSLSIGVDGLFGFTFINNAKSLKMATNIASEVWLSAMQVYIDNVYNRTSQTPGITREEIEKQVSQIIRPQFNCTALSRYLTWKGGKELFSIMKQSTVTLKPDNEIIQFNEDGYMNCITLVIMNSRAFKTDGNQIRTKWYKVGTWSMNSKHDTPSKTRFIIDGVTWPGRTNKPPIGRPEIFEMKVATLEEEPFVIYAAPNSDGSCDVNTIECDVQQQNETMATLDSSINMTAFNLHGLHNRTKRCCTGLTMDLLKQLSKDLDFKVVLFEVPDRKWGGWSQEKDEWNGLVRILQEKKADLVMTSFKITPKRSSAVDFSVPFQETGITIVVSLREGAISPTAFLEPYDYPSWCVILVFSVHACGAALFLYEWLSPQGLNRGNVPPRDKSSDIQHKFSLFRSLWLIWSMLFGAAVNADNPRGVASRFLASIWALFALVFLASYTANLAVFMIAKEDFYDLKGIKDWRLTNPLNHKPPFRFATVPNGATEENIKMNFKTMYEYMRNYNKSTVNEGIKALNNGEIDAFIYDAKPLEFKVSRDRYCKLRTVGNWYAMTGYGVAFPKNSKWLPLVNERILEYQRTGFLQRLQKFWLTGSCKKTGEVGNTNQTLGVKNFISAFILLVGGMIFCCLLLLMEHAFYRYMRPRLKDWDKYGCCGLVSISMGQLLSFEQSVNQTVDLIKHHKCRNPICETQLWKAQHELEIAKRRIRKLEASVAKHAVVDVHRKFSEKETMHPVSNNQHISMPDDLETSIDTGVRLRNRHVVSTPKKTCNGIFDSSLTSAATSRSNLIDELLQPSDSSPMLDSRSRGATPLRNQQHLKSDNVPKLSHVSRTEILYRHPRLRRSASSTDRECLQIEVFEKESVL